MVDEIYDREYRASREALNAAILGAFSRFGHAVRNAFEVLNRIEYSAPWAAKTRRVRSH
ncbi:MAG: hypothetical protein ACJ8D3_08505 [Sphingomicrobium sp.]